METKKIKSDSKKTNKEIPISSIIESATATGIVSSKTQQVNKKEIDNTNQEVSSDSRKLIVGSEDSNIILNKVLNPIETTDKYPISLRNNTIKDDLALQNNNVNIIPPEISPTNTNSISQINNMTNLNQTKTSRYFFRKRKCVENKEEQERETKRVRGLIARILGGNSETDLIEDVKALLASNSFDDEIDIHSNKIHAYISKEIQGIAIPRTYNEALNDPINRCEWENAINEEINALVSNGTWEESAPPPGTNLVSTKWVFTLKTDSDGVLERFKARLVARGFGQEYGIDYTKTLVPTLRMDTLRILMALVAKLDLECWHLDIKNAFTESPLKENIYLTPPKGVQVKNGKVLKLLKSLYGLKQA